MLKDMYKERREMIVVAFIAGITLLVVNVIALYVTVSIFAYHDNLGATIFALLFLAFAGITIGFARRWEDDWTDLNNRIADRKKFLDENRFF